MAWLVIVGLVILVLFLYYKFFKIPKLRNMVFVDGTLGAGKSFYCVSLAIRLYKRNHRRWAIARSIGKCAQILHFKRLSRLADLEEPCLFSNIPLANVRHAPITKDFLLRKERIPYKSIVFIDEISLVVDQFDYKDREISDNLRDFTKLFRHTTKGGTMIVNSQSTSDLHYSLKAVLSDYMYIHHRVKLPFFTVLKVQEMAYSSDKDANAVTNTMNQDIEENLKMVFVPNKYYKQYDSYCYSILTDDQRIYDDWVILGKKDSLKTKVILTFKEKGKTR